MSSEQAVMILTFIAGTANLIAQSQIGAPFAPILTLYVVKSNCACACHSPVLCNVICVYFQSARALFQAVSCRM